MENIAEPIARADRDQTTIYEQLTSRGVSRRDFLKFCGWMSACMGLGPEGLAQVANALETKQRIPVVWMHFQECTCCSESFLRSSHPIVADILLDKISLDYTEALWPPPATRPRRASRTRSPNTRASTYSVFEGSIPPAADGAYCCIGGRSASTSSMRSQRAPRRSSHGETAPARAASRPPSPIPRRRCRSTRSSQDKPIVNVQGCPPIAEVMAGVLVHLLDLRPDPAARCPGPPEGLLLAPRARHLLPPAQLRRRPLRRVLRRRERQEGLLPLQDGLPRPHHLQFLRRDPLEQRHQLPDPVRPSAAWAVPRRASGTTAPSTERLTSFPGFGIEDERADKIGLAVAAATVAGVAAHAVLTKSANSTRSASSPARIGQETPTPPAAEPDETSQGNSHERTNCCRSRHPHRGPPAD